MDLPVIGVDCSTNPAKVGLARATWSSGTLTVSEVAFGSKEPEGNWPLLVHEWIGDSTDALIALDAPLGWPSPLSRALVDHRAGERLPDDVTDDSDLMFQRLTDRVVRQTIGKKPIEVGANLIARTARDALVRLECLRQRLHDRGGVSLAWTPGRCQGLKIIEVYPAATLRSRQLPIAGYKGEIRFRKPNETDAQWRPHEARNTKLQETRRLLISRLREVVDIGIDDDLVTEMTKSDDIFDAVVCCVAARDFLSQEVFSPQDFPTEESAETAAEREGWIWVRKRAEKS